MSKTVRGTEELLKTLADECYPGLPAAELAKHESWVGLDDDGRPFAAAGALPIPDRHCHSVWAVVTLRITRAQAVYAIRQIRRWLDQQEGTRLETAIELHPAHVAWARALGFKEEGLMHNYYGEGRDGIMYARYPCEEPERGP